MFFKRFRKSPEIPKSELIEQLSIKDKYLVRTKPWDWLTKNEIYIMSKRDGQPAMITMDPWPQEIYLHANGQITVANFYDLMCKRYLDSRTAIPELLARTIIDEITSLLAEQLLECKDEITLLSSDLANPASKSLQN